MVFWVLPCIRIMVINVQLALDRLCAALWPDDENGSMIRVLRGCSTMLIFEVEIAIEFDKRSFTMSIFVEAAAASCRQTA